MKITKYLGLLGLGICISCVSGSKHSKGIPQTKNQEVNSPNLQPKPSKGSIRLAVSQKVFIDEFSVNVSFCKVISDSRCPLQVDCIQAGKAIIEVEVMGKQTRPRKFTLSTDPPHNYFVFSGKKYILEHLYPLPSKDVSPQDVQKKYLIDLRIEPTTESSSSPLKTNIR